MASGAAIGLAIYSLIILPGVAELSLGDIIPFIIGSDAIGLHKRILILNILTVIIGVIMLIALFLSLLLKWKHNKILAVIVGALL